MDPWIATLIGAGIGALAGYFFTSRAAGLTDTNTRRRDEEARARITAGHFAALAAEVDEASKMCRGYLADMVPAPAYRAAVFAITASYPALLAAGALTRQDSAAILRYYTCINSFNYGIEQVARGGASAEKAEIERVCIKAVKALPRGLDNPSLYDKMADVLKRNITDWQPLPALAIPDTPFGNYAKRYQEAQQARVRDGFAQASDLF